MNKPLKASDAKPKKVAEPPTATTAEERQPIAQPQPLATNQNEVEVISEISDADLAALATEARDLNDDPRVGDDLRFKKGKWRKIVGEEKHEIGKTTPFGVDLLSYQRGWIRWDNKKPTCKLIGRPIDGFISPVRSRLPDQDKSRWPHDNGQPTDPWQETLMITMRDLSDDRLCTLTITSWYGRQALGASLAVATRDCKKHPGCAPVVLLGSEEKSTVNFGEVAAPTFTIVDWRPFGDGAAPPGTPLPPPKLPPVQVLLPPSKETKTLGDAMDDEIPF
jgi:hypothetical protein